MSNHNQSSINMPLIGTAVVDYSIFGGCLFLFQTLQGDVPLSAVQYVLYLTTLLNVIHARDYLYLYILPHSVTAAVKRDYCITWWDLYFVGKQYVLFLGLTGALTAAGFFHLDPINHGNSAFSIFLQGYAIAMLKDNTGMRFLHPLMHDPLNHGKWWKIHAEHHSVHKDLRVITTFHGDWSDLILETVGGPVLYLAFLGLTGQKMSMHLFAWFGVVWMDINSHSINPYTVLFWNPMLDYVFKANITHNLHHAFNNDPEYTMFLPLRHVSTKRRQADLERYNQLMDTQVNFSLFVPTLRNSKQV